jgi:hypothetical protein
MVVVGVEILQLEPLGHLFAMPATERLEKQTLNAWMNQRG